MNEILDEGQDFTIDSIPEPENIEDVIYTLMVNPNLSSINYFNDFNEANISPDAIGNSDTDETGLFDIDSNGTTMAMSTMPFITIYKTIRKRQPKY
jgi:phosphoribosylformylglycinamidine synthase